MDGVFAEGEADGLSVFGIVSSDEYVNVSRMLTRAMEAFSLHTVRLHVSELGNTAKALEAVCRSAANLIVHEDDVVGYVYKERSSVFVH